CSGTSCATDRTCGPPSVWHPATVWRSFGTWITDYNSARSPATQCLGARRPLPPAAPHYNTPMDERTKLTLRTNLARDRAENLLARLRETFEQTQAEIAAGQRPDLSPEQIALGEEALRRAIASAERMVAN